MLLKMKTTYASPFKIVSSHDIGDFDAEEAKALLAGKYAVQPTAEEISEWQSRQKAKRSHNPEIDRG